MKQVQVVAAVIREGDKILATRRNYGEFKGGWEFPGGKVEVGETPQQALVRELREELHVKIVPGDLLDIVEYDYPTFHLSMRCYWATIAAGEPTLSVHDALRWLGAEEITSVAWLPADAGLVQQIGTILRSSEQG